MTSAEAEPRLIQDIEAAEDRDMSIDPAAFEGRTKTDRQAVYAELDSLYGPGSGELISGPLGSIWDETDMDRLHVWEQESYKHGGGSHATAEFFVRYHAHQWLQRLYDPDRQDRDIELFVDDPFQVFYEHKRMDDEPIEEQEAKIANFEDLINLYEGRLETDWGHPEGIIDTLRRKPLVLMVPHLTYATPTTAVAPLLYSLERNRQALGIPEDLNLRQLINIVVGPRMTTYATLTERGTHMLKTTRNYGNVIKTLPGGPNAQVPKSEKALHMIGRNFARYQWAPGVKQDPTLPLQRIFVVAVEGTRSQRVDDKTFRLQPLVGAAASMLAPHNDHYAILPVGVDEYGLTDGYEYPRHPLQVGMAIGPLWDTPIPRAQQADGARRRLETLADLTEAASISYYAKGPWHPTSRIGSGRGFKVRAPLHIGA